MSLIPFLACIAVCLSTPLAMAQTGKKPVKIRSLDANSVTSITYGSSAWNKDSSKIDTAYLFMRDKASGRLVQIQLEESEPDSSQFHGKFSVNIGEAGKTTPEIFVPPQELVGTDKNNKKLFAMIQSNGLPRKPVIWKKSPAGQPLLDVYDTREQATQALAAFNAQQRLAQPIKHKGVIKPATGETAVAAGRLAEYQAQMSKLAAEAVDRESDRIRLEQIEKQKADERSRLLQALSEKQRVEQKARAQSIADEALELYGKGRYPEAETKFKQSVDLDPENTEHYFKYGVTLYRNSKYNDALVILKLAQVDAQTQLEKRYFMGLTHYRLKEFDLALGEFRPVSKSKDKALGPPAMFYSAVILYSQEKYEDAKKAFEDVIDTSTDPKLDEQAESYLERLTGALAFKKMRENKFTLTGLVGAAYDSNVILSPDSTTDQGLATDAADFRLLTSADLNYRAVLTERHEFSTRASANLTNSVKEETAIADPFLYTLSAPYSYKGNLWSKGLKFTVKPGYEMLYMDPTSTGTKTNILNTYFVVLDGTFVMNPKWYAAYALEYRNDDSTTADSVGVNDYDANKITISTSQTFLLDKAGKNAFVANAAYVMNNANGENKKYNRIDGGVTYVRPTSWNASWFAGLSFYQLKYPDADELRSDFNTTLMGGLSKPVREWVTWGLMGSYTKNDSNIDSFEYSKFLILTTATFTTNF